MLDLICLKCNAKWLSEMLDRKKVYACPCCGEPNMRYMNEKGEATEIFPRPKDAA